ncbi:hypothetical protein Bca4012_099923 [Brassica carinata]
MAFDGHRQSQLRDLSDGSQRVDRRELKPKTIVKRRNSMKAEYDLDHFPHQSFYGDNSRTLVPMNKNSQIITKIKPKIRIIHIFAPEIINTDVKNFRTLVQSLTGKPEITKTGSKKKITRTNIPAPPPPLQESSPEHTAEPVNSFIGSHVVKEEWGSCSNTNTYFDLDGLIDLDEENNMFSSRWFDLQEQ